MKLVDDVGFDDSFCFIYSPRPGTPAADLPTTRRTNVKLERLQRLQAAIAVTRECAVSDAMVGTRSACWSKGRRAEGRERACRAAPSNNRVVNFAGAPAELIGRVRSTCASRIGSRIRCAATL